MKKKLKVLSVIVVLVLALLFWGYQKIERFADTPLAIQQKPSSNCRPAPAG